MVFGTIGNAATSEGMFLEAINAMGVLQIPVVMAIWDDDYGISVPNEYHTTKGDPKVIPHRAPMSDIKPLNGLNGSASMIAP